MADDVSQVPFYIPGLSEAVRNFRPFGIGRPYNSPSPQPAQPQYLPSADTTREMAGFAYGARGGNYPTPVQPARVTDLNAPSPTNTYGPDDGFAFRTRLATPGAPGQQVYKDYGLGGASIVATANQNGRFNSFSQGQTPPGVPQGPTLQDRYNAAVSRAAGLRSQPQSLRTRRDAALAMREANDIQTQMLEQQRLGYVGRQVSLAEQEANPRIARDTAYNTAIAAGNYPAIQAAQSALQGNPNRTPVQTIGGTYLVPNATLSGGASTYFPAFPSMAGQASPQTLRPLLTPLPQALEP